MCCVWKWLVSRWIAGAEVWDGWVWLDQAFIWFKVLTIQCDLIWSDVFCWLQFLKQVPPFHLGGKNCIQIAVELWMGNTSPLYLHCPLDQHTTTTSTIGCKGQVSGFQGMLTPGVSWAEDWQRRRNSRLSATPRNPAALTIGHIVVDEASPLKEYILKLYLKGCFSKEQRVFNYRLSWTRGVVENAFGVLSKRWCIFLSHIHLLPEIVDMIILACCTTSRTKSVWRRLPASPLRSGRPW